MIVYKPVVEEKKEDKKIEEPKVEYVTQEQLQAEISKIDLKDIDNIKKAIKDLESQISKLQGGSKKWIQ